MDQKNLTAKQQRFVEAYQGNATEAARIAGYNGSDTVLSQIGYENMRKPEIRAVLEQRSAKVNENLIGKRFERQKFLAEIANDPKYKIKDRIRALELLSKSEGDFTHVTQKSSTETLSDILMATCSDRS